MTVKSPSAALEQEQFDLIVIGSGAGGLATAVSAAHLGFSVLVLEKAAWLGGTSAWSGGWMWIPRNPLAVDAGIQESPDEPKRYLSSILGQSQLDLRVERFLEMGPEAIDFYRSIAGISFVDGNAVPDFYEGEGARSGGRSLCAAPFDGRLLGEWLYKMRPPLEVISLCGMGVASGQDLKHFYKATRSVSSAWYVTKRISRHIKDLIVHRRGTQLVNGNALIASLLNSALEKRVEIKTQAHVTQINKNAQGRVIGVMARVDGLLKELRARHAVVLATGGFPHDVDRQKAHFKPHAGAQHYSAAPNTNTGDGLRLAESVGGYVETGLAQPAAWAPVSCVPDSAGATHHFPHLIDRAKPGIIAVLPDGRRFVNEAESYHDFIKALLDATPKGQQPYCWLIADHKTQRKWGLGWSKPAPFPLRPYHASGYLKSAHSLESLASLCGINAKGLSEQVARFNEFARTGNDAEFHRGDSAYNRIQGDADHSPNPSLGGLQQGPFHAVKIVVGSLGTFEGIATDEMGRVLEGGGQVIDHLYAVGNDMSSIFGGHYPSGGITLGPALTFGYVIAKNIADSEHLLTRESSVSK
jgi:succinate dehydrogenase/fumarate reductase flavoprotein subunit